MNTIKLEEKAKYIRRRTFEMVLNAGTGHLGGSFSCLEILVYLYYGGILRFDPKNPKWEERDMFILSKGHANNSLYVILADLGFFPPIELDRFAKNGCMLGNHCDKTVPGAEIIAGSLGHGLGIASGIALGAKMDEKDQMVFVIIGDGECQEGSIWESGLFASHHNLNNLAVFLDRNALGAEDYTENTLKLNPLEKKWVAFGWDVKSINGHSFEEIARSLENCRNRTSQKPLIIIANTIKGKGMSLLENLPKSHHTLPKGADIEITRRDLA
ncbi:MAG: transketolase [Methanosarcinaceae archaeon]